MTDSSRPHLHDAFVSYSRKDEAFAALLEEALEAYKPPQEVDASRRHLDIFRDRNDFTGVEYSLALDRHLDGSATMIVICSPDSRASSYVDDEIRRFAAKKGADHIIPVLVAGTPNNEAASTDTSDLAFPAALCEALPMPLAADYRGFKSGTHKIDRGAFEGAWYATLANIYSLPRKEIEQRELSRRRRDRHRYASIAIVTLTLLALAGGVALWQRNSAKSQERLAEERRIVANVRQLALQSGALVETQNDLALLLGVEARRRADILESKQSLLTALLTKPHFEGFFWGDNQAVSALQFSADDGVLAAGLCLRDTRGCKQRELRLYDVNSRSLIRKIDKQAGADITALAFSADGTLLAAGDRDGSMDLLDVKTGTVRRSSHQEELDIPEFWGISGLAFSPDGKYLALGACGTRGTATSCDDSQVKVFDGTATRVVARSKKLSGGHLASLMFTGPQELRWLLGNCPQFTDSRTACPAVEINSWSLAAGSPVANIASSSLPQTSGKALTPAGPTAVAMAPGGNVLASSYCKKPEVFRCVQGGIQFTALDAGNTPQPFIGHVSAVTSLAFSPQERFLASGSEDGSIMLWRRTSSPSLGEEISVEAERLFAAAFSPNGASIAAGGCQRYADEGLNRGCLEPALFLISARDHDVKPVAASGLTGTVRAVAFSRDGKLLAAGSDSNRLVILTTSDRTVVSRASVEPNQSALALSFTPDNTTLIVGGKGGTLLWDVFSNRLRTPLRQVGGSVLAAAVSPDGKQFATGGEDRNITVWDLDDISKKPMILSGHQGSVTALQFDSRLPRLVSSAEDGIAVWDLRSSARLALPFHGHTGPTISIALSPDGKSAVSAGLDERVMLWDLESGQPLGPALSQKQAWRGVAFSPDGQTVVSVGHGSDISVWRVGSESWVELACRRANRNLTRAEWSVYFGDEPFRKTCSHLP